MKTISKYKKLMNWEGIVKEGVVGLGQVEWGPLINECFFCFFLGRPCFRGNCVYKCTPIIGDRINGNKAEDYSTYVKKYEDGIPINKISSISVKTEKTKLYKKYALEMTTIITEKKREGIHYGVYRYQKIYYSPNVVSLIAKWELNLC